MNKVIDKYEQKIYQNILLLLFDKDFKTKFKQLHLVANSSKPMTSEELLTLTDKIEALRMEYNLSPPHFVAMQRLILSKEFKQAGQDGYIKHPEFKTITDHRSDQTLYLAIYPEMTIEDIRAIWPQLQKASKETYGYDYKRHKSYNNTLIVFNYAQFLKSLGRTNKEVASMIKNIFPKENLSLTYSDLPARLNDIKSAAQKFKNKLMKGKKR